MLAGDVVAFGPRQDAHPKVPAARYAAGSAAADATLVERFDIGPFSDFSAK